MDIAEIQKEIDELAKKLEEIENIKHINRIETQLPTNAVELKYLLDSVPVNGLLVAKNDKNEEVIYQKISRNGQYIFDQISFTEFISSDSEKWAMYVEGSIPTYGPELQAIIDALPDGGIVIDDKK